jgi:thiol-disulfide isomerase/thioredoxin
MRKNNSSYKNIFIAFGVIVVAAIGYSIYDKQQPGPLDTFAQCVNDSGAKFYGAFWCPHCQAQKAIFSKSKDLLPYIECSTPDGNGQNAVCKDKAITSYPTWEFASSTGTTTDFFPGEKTLSEIAEKSKCTLPAGF